MNFLPAGRLKTVSGLHRDKYQVIMKIFSGSANKPLAEKIAKDIALPLSTVETFVFPDGERRVRITENVVDEHVILVQSASTPVDQQYMELFFLLDGLKRSGASQITVVIPYFGYQRQDHVFRDGEAVSLEVIIKILDSLKINRLISIDMHSSRIPDLFPSRIAVSHVSALELFAKKIKHEKWNTKDTILISPDMGGIRRIKILSEMLENMQYAATEKNRDLESGKLEEHTLGEGSVTGKKRAIIVDDMISSGGTMVSATSLMKKYGVEEVHTFATHAVFSSDASEVLQSSLIQKVFVTDTVYIPEEKKFEKLEIMSVDEILGIQLKI